MRSSMFKTSLLYTAIILGFSCFQANAANVMVKGKLTINGEKVTISNGPDIAFGNAGDVIKIDKHSGDSLFVYGGKLVVNGSSIEVVGADSAVRSQRSGNVLLGSIETDKLTLLGTNYGALSLSGSKVVLNAKHLELGLTDDSKTTTVAGANADSGTLIIGQNAESITIKGLAKNEATKNSAVGLKASDVGVANIGGALTETVTIESSHNEEAYGVYALGSKSGSPTVEVNASDINISASSNNYVGGVTARHCGPVHIGDSQTNSVVINVNSKGTKIVPTNTYTSCAYGIQAYNSKDEKTSLIILGKDITSSATANLLAVGAYAGTNSVVTIGDENTNNVRIEATNAGDHSEAAAIGVWVDNTVDWNKDGGQMTIAGKNISIHAESRTDATAIHVASNKLDQDVRSSLTLDGDNILIESKSTNATVKSVGIAAMSAGDVKLTGNTVITADYALLTRGDASIEINKDGKHSTQINGDVVFDYDTQTSGTGVNANVDVTLAGANSYWNGNTVVAWAGLPDDIESDKLTVTDMKLTVKDGAQWTPTAIASTDPTAQNGQRAVALNSLALDNGVVNITDKSVNATVEKMSGSGTVRLATDLTAEKGQQTGTFTVDSATENSSLTVKLTNEDMSKELTADDVTSEQAKDLLGNVAAQDVETTMQVVEGMYNGAFDVTDDGSTITRGPNSVMQSTLELATVAPLALNRILTNDVHKRMGDIRSMTQTSGAWARYDGGKLSSESGLENDFHTIQVGVDTVPVTDAPRFGVAFSYTTSDADYKRGEADMDVYSLAAYGLWMGESGQFVDVVARLGTAKSDMTVDGNKKGSMENIVTALSGEFGWRFDIAKSFYLEPQVELAYTHVDADDLSLSDGSTYRFDDGDSLMGRAGFMFGMQCPENGNTAYLRISAVHEFLGDNAVTGGNGTVYEIDGKDTWVEYGLGANFNLTDNTYFWADVERTSGGYLDEDWRATVGVRYAF